MEGAGTTAFSAYMMAAANKPANRNAFVLSPTLIATKDTAHLFGDRFVDANFTTQSYLSPCTTPFVIQRKVQSNPTALRLKQMQFNRV